MNRITEAVQRARVRIQGLLDSGKDVSGRPFGPAELAKASAALDIDISEFASIQTLKSLAAGSLLTFEEAQTVYAYLGTTPATFNGQDLAVKTVLTRLFGELLEARIRAKRRTA